MGARVQELLNRLNEDDDDGARVKKKKKKKARVKNKSTPLEDDVAVNTKKDHKPERGSPQSDEDFREYLNTIASREIDDLYKVLLKYQLDDDTGTVTSRMQRWIEGHLLGK